MQHHDLIGLAGVLECAPVGGFDPQGVTGTVQAGWPLRRPGPDMNTLPSLHPLNDYTWQS
ncbi:hypothetical protein [Zwartia vadi]|uniref:hypothetical protein n=1 Tax=Zwartia vadi TaxID=3058168 RepID=UPI0025B32F8D|nr:hypothetical protein [Zwartia vadi]